MEHETHNNNIDHQHIIDITNDDNPSSGSSLDEGSYYSLRSSLSTDEGDDGVESIEGASYSTSRHDCIWNTIVIVVNLAEIVAALLVLTHAKVEHPHALLLTWLIGYSCGCTTYTLLILSRRFLKYNQIGRMDRVMDAVAVGIDYFFGVWLVLGIVWICDGNSSPSDAPKHYRLFIVFIAFLCITYAVEVLLWIGSVRKEGLGGGIILHKPSPDDHCCICLVKYGKDLGVLKELECSHVFHLKCIENWLMIKPTCPLCQSKVWGYLR